MTLLAVLLALTCGVERWSVKTLTDPGADKVQLTSPGPNTIETIRGMKAPAYADTNPRVTGKRLVL